MLSHNSPLGVRFHYLKGTSSYNEKLSRINNGKPGGPCTEKHLAFNTELTKEPFCTGPNIVNFSNIVSQQTMADHIYGRKDILTNKDRPHMFIAELNLYPDYLKEMLTGDIRTNLFDKNKKKQVSFYHNLRNGLAYDSSLPLAHQYDLN